MIEKLDENPQAGAINWLLQMELATNPAVLNTLIANIVATTRGVKDVQLVIDESNLKILIYVELTRFHSWFFKEDIEVKLNDMFEQILPSYKKRITFDKILLERALRLIGLRENPKEVTKENK